MRGCHLSSSIRPTEHPNNGASDWVSLKSLTDVCLVAKSFKYDIDGINDNRVFIACGGGIFGDYSLIGLSVGFQIESAMHDRVVVRREEF